MTEVFYSILHIASVSLFTRVHGKLFWRIDGKMLDAIPIASAPTKTIENCLGQCLYDKRCKSFNVVDGQCNMFDLDRCAPWVNLVDEPKAYYFDLVKENNQCPLKSKFSFTTFHELVMI